MNSLASPLSQRVPNSEWRLVAIGGALVFAFAAHWPAAMQLHTLWLDSTRTTYTHGYLVAAVSLWLLWRRRRSLLQSQVQPVALALLLLAGAELVALLAAESALGMISLCVLPVAAWLALLAIFGAPVARAMAFPLGYLYFALPAWAVLNPLAKWGTVYAVRPLLTLAGVTAHFDGDLVLLPAGTFHIAGGCSGLHFIIVAGALAALLGELRNDVWRVRLKLLGVAMALAVFANWLRVFTIILAGDLTQMQHYLVRVSHYGFGWAVFAAAMAVFFWYERRLPVPHPPTSAAGDGNSPRWRLGIGVVLTATLLMMLPLLIGAVIEARTAPVGVRMPVVSGAWQGPQPMRTAWQPALPGADAQGYGSYRAHTGWIEVYSAALSSLHQGKELEPVADALGEHRTTIERSTLHLGADNYLLEKVRGPDGRDWLQLRGYTAGGRTFSTPLAAQLWAGAQAVLNLRPVPARLLLMRAPCGHDCSVVHMGIETLLTSADFNGEPGS